MTADFIDRAKAARSGPPGKPKADPQANAEARKVRSGGLGSIRGGLKPRSVVDSGKSTINPGSSAGLRNETKATLEMPGGGLETNSKRNQSRLDIPKGEPRNPLGQVRGGKPIVTDLTLKGKSAASNSIGALEKRTKLNRVVR